MLINGKEFTPLDTRSKITMADSFVVKSNKLGTANGEAKLYIGQESEELESFYGAPGRGLRCFLMRDDMLRFLDDLKPEYMHPVLDYRLKNELPNLFMSRLDQVSKLPEFNWFTITQSNVEPPRVYVNSSDPNYKLIRELSLPNLSYLSVMKLGSEDGEVVYYFRLFHDYLDEFGQINHPAAGVENGGSESGELPAEEKAVVSRARLGQAKYRRALLEECPFCPVTMVTDDRILIASHIKPYSHSSAEEKYDPKNGFMFTPTIDYLFDQGFITFEDNKKILISPWLSKPTISRLGLRDQTSYPMLPTEGREKYLSYHRASIFNGQYGQ
jgi:putative restriction endonuclease